MERETIDFIASCEDACFSHPWTSDEVQSCICSEYGVCVIENGIGYAIGRISFDEAELYRIAVLPEKRRVGAGKRLLTGFIDECVCRGAEKIFLEVHAKNVPAVSLYEQTGFTRISVRRGYYGDDDALIYCLNV